MSNDSNTTQQNETIQEPETNEIDKQSSKNKKLIVSKILKDRRKLGEEQLLVVYSHEKGEKGHWVPQASLDCQELIDEYFAKKAKDKSEGSKKSQARQIVEICGIIPKDGKIFSFEVLFKDTGKKEIVPVSTMHKHYTKQLLSFYESHIEPQQVKELPTQNVTKKDVNPTTNNEGSP